MPHQINVVNRLFEREIGLSLNRVVRHHQKILKSVVCSDQRRFVLSKEPFITQGDFIYGDGKLYQRNNAKKTFDCYSLLPSSGDMKRLYSLPTRPKWEDQEIVILTLPNGKAPPLPDFSHRACLFVLRLNNTLHRYDLQTGTDYETLYLSSQTRFKELSFDTETGLLALKSIRRISGSCRGALSGCNNKGNVLVNFIILRYPPTKFVAHFEVTRSIFGDKIVDAAVNQGILIVMHSDNNIRLYSVQYILNNFIKRDYHLNDETKGGNVIGQSPLGLPVNVEITHIPPCLMEVQSHHHHLQIGSIPWRYIVCQGEGQFEVEDLLTRQPLRNGSIKSIDVMEPDHLLFHPDDSSRIVHISNSQLRILDIIPCIDSSSNGKLHQVFSFCVDDSNQNKEVDNLPITPHAAATTTTNNDDSELKTSSGRRIIRPVSFKLENMADAKHDLSFDYEDELDILAVLYALEYVPDDEEDFCRTRLEKVVLIDNKSQKILREIPIGQEIRQGSDVSSIHVTLDRDVLLIRVRSSVKATAFVFRLLENATLNDEDHEQVKKLRIIPQNENTCWSRSRRPRGSRRNTNPDARKLRRRSTWNEPYSDLDEENENNREEEEENRPKFIRRRHRSYK